MGYSIPPSVKRVWEQWNIRGALLFSLSLQTILVLFAPSRKRTSRRLIILMVWSGYLLADAVANFAVGLISNSQTSGPSDGKNKNGPKENPDLLAFWAPFLLLHLGGPDTITAFALEDNALWLRHLLSLIIQAVATGYVFLQTFPTNKVMIPTFIMFLAGIIKYLERTRSLYLASMDRFRDSMLKEPDPGPNYAKLMEEYASKKEAKLPTEIIYMPEPEKDIKTQITEKVTLEELDVVQKAYRWFNLFKGLIVDLIFSFKERNESRDLFDTLRPEDALRVIEVELNFIYEVLFTKVVVVHSNLGIFFRLLAFSSIVTSLAVFRFHVKKHGYYNAFDVGVTYALLFGAIGLDIVSLLMAIFSDWTVASIDKPDKVLDSRWRMFTDCISRKSKPFFVKFLEFKRSCQFDYMTETPLKHTVVYIPFIFRRWSSRVSGYNLIRYCLKGRPEGVYKVRRVTILSIAAEFLGLNLIFDFVHGIINKATELAGKLLAFLLFPLKQGIKNLRIGRVKDWLIDQVGLKDVVDEIMYSSKEPFTREIWTFIFDELQRKSQFADDPETAKRICSARGEWIIQENDSEDKNRVEQESEDKDSEKDRPDLMPYVVDVSYDESLLLWHLATELLYNTEIPDHSSKEKLFSKLLSDYMLYLLIVQPGMMTSVAGIGKIRYRDTCAEAERFIKRRSLGSKDLKAACEKILDVNTEVKPIDVKGDRSKSVLFDACRLAKELQKLKEKKWEKLSKIWVELLSYAASHIRANAHAQQVSKGGELVSLVWLLMAHFGIGDQFQINEGHARAKLIVGK
ncbi:hypothetical protein K2173_020214 [Erythroxylum novogranatense]|uniref:DUF4220 domain-containing protein n=1 Tax=Erythroxylum novogranatense TaxID=1862640 RepID=A0AAV8U7F4_9ROSI|nr:hypothetical protein K2173_020214 [Erythroxylum novogranatense]